MLNDSLSPVLHSVDPPLSNFIDAKSLAEELAGNFMGVVQYNNDNTDFEVFF